MAIQFGIWNLDGKRVDPALVMQACDLLGRYAGVATSVVDQGTLVIILGLNRSDTPSPATTTGPRTNTPHTYWEGRLDNRAEVARRAGVVPGRLTDDEIIERAYEACGNALFPQILGDWALCVADVEHRELILATDFLAAKRLFYRAQNTTVTWSTVLESLVLLASPAPSLSEEYLAGWLSFFPRSELTPYRDIFAVPPASLVRITPGKISSQRYWRLESSSPVRYRDDREYEEHFRSVFRESVRRRIRPAGPLLAELSGGMDSSSIVCVADDLCRETNFSPKIDTVTYFDAAEPNWDELPFASTVEQRRGRIGHHIDIGPDHNTQHRQSRRFTALPASSYSRSSAADAFDRLVSEHGYRAVLSGLGGDELLGGVPTPLPELADLVARIRVMKFARQSVRWAVAKKKHVWGLWRSTVCAFLPRHNAEGDGGAQGWDWLTPEFRVRNQRHLGFHPSRFYVLGPLPSLQANVTAVETLSRQISCVPFPDGPHYEWRYPYLDRDLVTYCSSIPREQLVRPCQRRSLMRRSLQGVVPREILERRRKAYVSRGLVKVLVAHWKDETGTAPLHTEELGITDSVSLRAFVEQANQGGDVPILPLLRTLALEQWLREISLPAGFPHSRSLRCGLESAHSRGADELLGRERPTERRQSP